MTANQHQPLARNPNNIDLTLIATYERQIPAAIERVWENVLDWEHLPALHETSFDYVELDAAGDWGWRTWSNAERSAHVELCVPDDRSGGGSYVARSYVGDRQVSEIWTRLDDGGATTGVLVELFASDVRPGSTEKLGSAYRALYQQLWDEDEAMITERARRLTEPRSRVRELDLGPLAGNPTSQTVAMMGQEYRVELLGEEIVITPTICPHLLGPLERLASGELYCPWHGYRFDAATGQCNHPANARCQLPRRPSAIIEETRLILRDPSA